MASEQQQCHIYKAPDHIRRSNPDQYKPLAFPVGPYHARAGVAAPEKARRIKEQCVGEVVQLSGRSRDDFLGLMRSVLDRAKRCYADEIDMDDGALEEMLLLDGCFVLVSLRGTERLVTPEGSRKAETSAEESSESSDDRCSNCSGEDDVESQMAAASNGAGNAAVVDSWHHFNVARDLFLMENQIPFFVVQKIYELLIKNHPYAERGVVTAVEEYVREVMAVYAKGADGAPPPADHVHHLLHLSHMHLRPRIHPIGISRCGFAAGGALAVGRLRRATQLHELAVRFRKRDAGSILDVAFRGGVLEIPRLEVDGGTWRQMANLVLLEKASPHVGLYVTAYCAFMSQLAGTADDVALLCERGVIEHHLGGDGDVAEGLRRLCDGVIFDANDDACNYLRPVYQALEEHCRRRTPRLIRWLGAHASCPNPWMVLGVLAIIALLCFILQQLQHAALRNPAT
ncbi:uncharacterized protein LOC102703810 [Oryza brachyantha]|uniref:uncharacterized protein LOC102703810 n=1 Tax=Oryza brachyantha TaxID=4533 RepID=UPI001ADD0FBA|nr:uncharacterized protein LOC102703810 [Oryza brachyantha]